VDEYRTHDLTNVVGLWVGDLVGVFVGFLVGGYQKHQELAHMDITELQLLFTRQNLPL
jgi:hypothetical protein